MDDDDIFLPYSPSTSDPTPSSLPDISKTGSSVCASSGIVGQRAELLLTRRHSITWISTMGHSSSEPANETLTSPPWTPPAPHQQDSDDREEYASCSRSLSEGGITRQGSTENPHATMTDSALIAYGYRMAQARDCEAAISLEAPVTIESASCRETRAAMRCVTAGIEDLFQDPDEKLSKRVQSSLRLHDMLCSVPPRIIEKTSNALTDEARKESEEHAVLYNHRWTPHTTVVDSIHPDLAPHIVITPPSDDLEGQWWAQHNTIGVQNRAHLFVQPFYMSTSRLPTDEESVAMFYPSPPVVDSEIPTPPAPTTPFNRRLFKQWFERTAIDRASNSAQAALLVTHRLLLRSAAIAASKEATGSCTRYTPHFLQSVDDFIKSQLDQMISTPRRVFDRSDFHAFVEHTYDERTALMTHAAVSATHRLQLRLVFFSASVIAKERRTIYDDRIYLGSIERRFKWKWNDPAEAFFEQLGPRPTNAVIIDSENPFTAPHIIIHFAKLSDPWTVWVNETGVQDCAHGNSLTVGFGLDDIRYKHINIPGGEAEELDERSYPCDFDEEDCSLSDDASCTASSSCPETPGALQRVGSGFFSETDEEEDTDTHWRYEKYPQFVSGDVAEDPPIWNESLASSDSKPEYPSKRKFYLSGEDEEEYGNGDDLPQYDDWYITIAIRTKLAFR